MNQKHKRLITLLIVMLGTPSAVLAQNTQSAAQEIGTYHWRDGCTQDGKVCGKHLYRDGLALLSLTVNGVSVDVVLVDTGNVMLVATAVGNETKHAIDVVPQLFSLSAVKSKPKNLNFLDPELFAKKMGKVASSDVNWMMTAVALVKSRITTETGLSAATRSRLTAPEPSTNTTQSSQEKDPYESRREGDESDPHVIHGLALQASIVPSRCFVTGIVFFETDREADQLLLRIPAGGYVFEFAFVRR